MKGENYLVDLAFGGLRDFKGPKGWDAKGHLPSQLEKKMETQRPFKGMYRVILGLYWDYIGIMEKKMETTIVYCGSTWTKEKSMETTIMGYTTILSIFAIMTISNICTIITIITQRNPVGF